MFTHHIQRGFKIYIKKLAAIHNWTSKGLSHGMDLTFDGMHGYFDAYIGDAAFFFYFKYTPQTLLSQRKLALIARNTLFAF
jgi:hypothetical protein